MKVIYGATFQTNRREINEYFIDEGLFPNKIDYQAVSDICSILREASKEVFPMAFEAFDWIKDLYRIE